MILQYEDIEHLLPAIKSEVKKELSQEDDKFLSYPKGIQNFLFGSCTSATYQKVYRLWTIKNFPRSDKEGLRGVYLKDLKNWHRD